MKKGSINLQYFYEEKGNEKTGHEYTDQAPAPIMDILMKINGFKQTSLDTINRIQETCELTMIFCVYFHVLKHIEESKKTQKPVMDDHHSLNYCKRDATATISCNFQNKIKFDSTT